MKGWEVKSLGELCEINLGRTPYRGERRFWDETRITNNVWLSIADLLNSKNNTVFDSSEYISEDGALVSKIVKSGTLLLSFKLTLGRVAFAGRDLYTNEAIAALPIIARNTIDKEFLFYYFNYFDWKKAAENDAKIKGLTLNKAKLKVLPVPLPPLDEQRRIVAVLYEAFAGLTVMRQHAEANLENARALFDSHLNAIFSQRGDGWVETTFDQLCDIKHGFAFKSEFFTDAGDHVLLTPGNFYEAGGYRDRGDKQKFYVGEIPDGYVLSEGDLLVAMTEQAAGLLGSPILVPESGKFLHNQRLGLVVGKPGTNWTNDFFFYVFNTKFVRQEIHDSASGVKVRHTSPSKIGEVPVSYPKSKALQLAIVSQLTELQVETTRLETLYRKKLAAIDELKQSILHRAFSGQLTGEAITA